MSAAESSCVALYECDTRGCYAVSVGLGHLCSGANLRPGSSNADALVVEALTELGVTR